ncbi:MAG: type II toxin-antitoxin system RelE family toxin [Candidatus Kariarchaeaceae archaeon]|jgi:mRNA interferase RelE/StbE
MITKKAEKSLRILKKRDIIKFREITEQLKISPFNYPYKKIKGKQNTYRIRIRGFRILYKIDKGNLLIFIIDIDKRGTIFK